MTTSTSRALRSLCRGAFTLLTLTGVAAGAQQATPPSCADHNSLADAWWTGPMLANSAATLPRGHVLIEPYLYDVVGTAQYGGDGVRRSVPRSNGFGSLTYIVYGLTDRVGLGLIPTAGFNTASGGLSSSG